MSAETESHTRLQGRWLLVARLVSVAAIVLAVILHVAALPVAFDLFRSPCFSEPCDTRFESALPPDSGQPEEAALRNAWNTSILEVLVLLLSLSVALFIFWRRSDDWMAHLASIMLVSILTAISPWPTILVEAEPVWHWPRALSWAIGLGSSVGMFYLFPDGRFVPRWTGRLAMILLFIIAFVAVLGAPLLAGLAIFVVILVTGTVFQIYRYRLVSGPIQRQQTKWVVLGILGMALPMVFVLCFGILNPSLSPFLSNGTRSPQAADLFSNMVIYGWAIPVSFFPVTLAFSILRYRLWDVDFFINRTLVYGTLTASVVALYVLIVGGSSIGLQTQNNISGILIAILVIALIFRPLRHRLQRMADSFIPVPQPALPLPEQKDKSIGMEGRSNAGTTLTGNGLIITRLAWVAMFTVLTVMYALGFLAVHQALSTVCEEEPCTLRQQIRHADAGEHVMDWGGPPEGYADPLRPDQIGVLETLGLTLDQYGWLGALQLGIPALLYLLIAAGLFWWKSNDWMVLFISTMVATLPFVDMPLPYTLLVHQPIWQWIYIPADFVAVSSFFIFPLIFPTGQFVPRWTRWKAFFDIAFAIYDTLSRNYILRLPLGWDAFPYIILSFVTNAYALSYRYFRVASPVERQQIKWVVVGVVGFISIAFPVDRFLYYHPIIIDSAQALLLSAIPDTIYRAITLFIPISIAISVMRYRLWDIDVLINRTLVYGALTGIVVSAFVILVGFISLLIQSSGNSIIAIIATGLVALLFNPLRLRLQRSVNQLMYGDRDEPYTALSRLGRRLETTLAPEFVLPTVVTTVREALNLPYAAIYLKQPDNDSRIIAESASPSLQVENGKVRVPGMEREGLCMPLIHQGETLGYLVLGPRAPNEAFGQSDHRLLDDLAPQVGVAVHSVRLTADLQRSREQLVLAREEERRRLRRDLHDGLGPQLAGLALKLETLRNRMNGDPLADSILADLAKRTQDATADIRHLVYELRPPTLDELGLISALRKSAEQFTQQGYNNLNISFEAPESLPPLPAAVEVAVYRIAQEALTNVIRHADAHTCHIRLGLDALVGFLILEVQDDGKGLLMNRRAGVGLNSMRERAEELGGTFTITSLSTGGTRLVARIPCGADDRNTMDASRKESQSWTQIKSAS